MPQSLGPVVLVRGRVRQVEPMKNRDQAVIAARVTVLTEPNGGFLEVTVWPNQLGLDESLALSGQDVEALVTLGVFVSQRGGGFQQATAVWIRPWDPTTAQDSAQLRAV